MMHFRRRSSSFWSRTCIFFSLSTILQCLKVTLNFKICNFEHFGPDGETFCSIFQTLWHTAKPPFFTIVTLISLYWEVLWESIDYRLYPKLILKKMHSRIEEKAIAYFWNTLLLSRTPCATKKAENHHKIILLDPLAYYPLLCSYLRQAHPVHIVEPLSMWLDWWADSDRVPPHYYGALWTNHSKICHRSKRDGFSCSNY